MSDLTAPPLGTYTVLPPTADEINHFLRLMRDYRDAEANGFANENSDPSLYATINGVRARLGVIENDNGMLLLCSSLLPPKSDYDCQLGRVYFALIGEHINADEHEEPAIVEWETHPGLLVTETAGDANTMTPLALAKTMVQLLGG